ncbi:MAG: hypothetical protein ACOC3V_03565, partial [bacterium]
KKGIESDYRYRKLSDEGKKEALKRAADQSRMQDAQRIREWMNKLQASIDIKNKRKAASKNVYGSVFDGLK